jgi:hypothetical protein
MVATFAVALYVAIDDWRSRHQRRVDPDINHHLYTWTPLLLANLLREAGFADPDCRSKAEGCPAGRLASCSAHSPLGRLSI